MILALRITARPAEKLLELMQCIHAFLNATKCLNALGAAEHAIVCETGSTFSIFA